MPREFYTIGRLDEDEFEPVNLHPDNWFAASVGEVPVRVEPTPRADRGPQKGWPAPAKLAYGWLPSGQYELQPGDTLSGLARTYLGSFARYKEIWALQPPEFKNSPRRLAEAKRKNQTAIDVIFAGEHLEMPPEAIAEAREQGLLVWLDAEPETRDAAMSSAGVSKLSGKTIAGLATIGLVGFGLAENWFTPKRGRTT